MQKSEITGQNTRSAARQFRTFTLRAAAAALFLAGSTLAFGGPDHDRHGGHGPGTGFDASRDLARAVKRLELTEVQQEAIKNLFEENREDLKVNRKASSELRQQLRALMDAETLDQDALAELAEREGALAEERVLLGGTLASQVLAELDEDQREELMAMRDARQERRRARFSARENRDE